MSIILSLWGLVTALFPFVVLLGILVFIHEWGHFIVARFCGVRVEVFSLGFGKKILKWKRKGTVYCISLFPLGGYVKMFGHDYTKEVAEHEKPVAFLHKKLWQRTAIVLAGPLMNFFLAIVLFAALSMSVGETHVHPVIGEISPSSPAFEAGLRHGDRLLSIDGVPVVNATQVRELIFYKPESQINLKVQNVSGETKTLKVLTQKGNTTGRWGFVEEGGVLEGLDFFAPQAMVGVMNPKSPAGQAGLKTFDEILSVNEKPVRDRKSLFRMLSFKESRNNSVWNLTVKRKGETHNLSLTKPLDYKHMGQLGLTRSDLFIADLKQGGAGDKAGLQKGDFVFKINGERVPDWAFLVHQIQAFDENKGPLQVEIKRKGKLMLFPMTPEKRIQILNGVEHREYMVGIVTRAPYAPVGGYYTAKHKNPIKALGQGIEKSFYYSALIGIYIKKLATGEVSRKTLGGAVSIGRAAYNSYSHGLATFFRLMAVLSVQLFLLNILPIPLFDGGHLMFYAIEFFNGAPLSMKKMLIVQQVGVVFLLFLLIFTTFNDIHNWFFLW